MSPDDQEPSGKLEHASFPLLQRTAKHPRPLVEDLGTRARTMHNESTSCALPSLEAGSALQRKIRGLRGNKENAHINYTGIDPRYSGCIGLKDPPRAAVAAARNVRPVHQYAQLRISISCVHPLCPTQTQDCKIGKDQPKLSGRHYYHCCTTRCHAHYHSMSIVA